MIVSGFCFPLRFSGLKAADLKDVKTTLTDVQAILLNLFSDKTILMGHSLESDCIALKVWRCDPPLFSKSCFA